MDDASRAAPSLISVRDWLIQSAMARTEAAYAGGRAWPAYVRTRHYRVVVLLTLRIAGQHRRGDPSPLLQLGTHLVQMCQSSDVPQWVGVALAALLLEELQARTALSEDGVPTMQLGLRVDEVLWCHALVETQILPTLLPALLHVLHTATERVQHASNEQASFALDLCHAVSQAVKEATHWRSIPIAAVRDDATVAAWTPEQVWQSVEGLALGNVDDVRSPLSTVLAPILHSPDLPPLLGTTGRLAQTIAADVPSHAWAAHQIAQNVHASMQAMALYVEPNGSTESAWKAQRVALFAQLDLDLQAMAPRLSQVDTDSLAVLQRITHIYTRLLQGKSALVLLHGAMDPAALLQTLARVSATCYHIAFALVPSMNDAEATAASDMAVEEALGLWRSLLAELPNTDKAGLYGSICEQVVLPYQTGRLQAAATSAETDDEEMGEEQGRDVDVYDEQLTMYAALARPQLDRVLPALAALKPAMEGTAIAPAVWEQWHWLALLLGHILADPASRECVTAPEAIQHASHETKTHVWMSIHTYWTLLQSLVPQHPMTAMPASPQTVESLLWLVARWVPTYLFNEISPLVGDDGEHMLDAMIACMYDLITSWKSEEGVMMSMAHVWEAWTYTPGVMTRLLAKPAVLALVRETLQTLETLPAASQVPLLRALVRCVDAARDSATASASETRAAYYPLLLEAAQARMEAAAHAPAVTMQTALGLWEAMAAAADPQVSGQVHTHMLARMSAIVDLAQAQGGQADVQMAALQATQALLQAWPELADAASWLTTVSSSTAALLQVVPPTLLSLPRGRGVDATVEELLIAYLSVVTELLQAGTNVSPDVPTHDAQHPTTCSVQAFVAIAPILDVDMLRVPRVRDAVARLLHILLLVAQPVLLASTANAAMAAWGPTPYDGQTASVLTYPGASLCPLHMVLRGAVYVMGTADTLTETSAGNVAQALGYLAEALPELPASAQAALVQHLIDSVACDILCALLLRPLHKPMLTPLLLALRKITLARMDAAQLGGQATFLSFIAEHLTHMDLPSSGSDAQPRLRAEYSAAAEHILQTILTSRAPASPAHSVPAIAARMQVKAEMTAAVGLNRLLRPYIWRTRSTLILC